MQDFGDEQALMQAVPQLKNGRHAADGDGMEHLKAAAENVLQSCRDVGDIWPVVFVRLCSSLYLS